jgi:hypothetical protein
MNFYKQAWFWIIVFSVFISGVLLYFSEDINQNFTLQKDAKVVVVNDEFMTKREFMNILDQATYNYRNSAEGDFSEEEIKDFAIQMTIDQLLLLSYGKKMAVEISDYDIEDFYGEIILHEPNISTRAELFEVWKSDGYDKEEMERQVRIYLMYDKIYEHYLDKMEVEDSDIQNAYEEYLVWMNDIGASEEEVMALEEIEDDLKSFILQEKALEKMETDIDKFKEKSFIESFI